MTERQFKYRWARTGNEVAEDYRAFDGESGIGRVHRVVSVSAAGWAWACNAHLEWFCSDAGTVATKEDACHAVEAAYDALKASDCGRQGARPALRQAGSMVE